MAAACAALQPQPGGRVAVTWFHPNVQHRAPGPPTGAGAPQAPARRWFSCARMQPVLVLPLATRFISDAVEAPRPPANAGRDVIFLLVSSRTPSGDLAHHHAEMRWQPLPGVVPSAVEGPRAPIQQGTRWQPTSGVVLSDVEGPCPSPRWDGVASPSRCRPELVEGLRAPNRVGVRWRSPPGVIPSAVEGSCPQPARNAARA